ncbi:unnamed protein product [Durusdinium trenchii]|uniref:Uncharacterized protein n=3 Tax=Durusdinium trenchii TaxID=1381693 RepID=A0ABP0J466_9DINO
MGQTIVLHKVVCPCKVDGGMPGRILSSLLGSDEPPGFDSHVWQTCRAPHFQPGFEVKLPRHEHWYDFVSFKKKRRGNDMNKCLCPVLGHCVPGFQCPLGEHIDSSKCFKTVSVKYPPDSAYQNCMKNKEEDPTKKCHLKILEDLKIRTGGWMFSGGEDHPIAWKVKGLAKDAGVKRGYELIAIDGNQADWREPGMKAYLKGLNWNTPPRNAAMECEPGDGCKTPIVCYNKPPPPPPPIPPPLPLPGLGEPAAPVSLQQIEAPVQEPGMPASGGPGPPALGPGPPGLGPGPAAPVEAPLEPPAPPPVPCYPNGHSLTFKVSAPVWMFFSGPKTTCKPFRETCCSEASTRGKPEDIFVESCASKEMCKPQESCDKMPGRPGICKYQVTELKGDYDEVQENEQKQEEAAAKLEEQEQEQEQQEEEEEGE